VIDKDNVRFFSSGIISYINQIDAFYGFLEKVPNKEEFPYLMKHRNELQNLRKRVETWE
jgi:hypothetical protein